ncbi:MAG: 4Fe-4S double cluster binding domain-containing protein [Promethearchaeia archaeon]
MVTNAPLKTGTPIRESTYCKDCNKCIQACPADALTDGNYNKAACLQYNQNNLQHLSDHSVLWCNECIEACPVGTLQKE